MRRGEVKHSVFAIDRFATCFFVHKRKREDFKNHDYWSRINILSEAIYDVFEPLEVVGFTPEEWDKQTSPLYDYAKQGEILYAV